uniref:THAP domain-containing protein 1 n=1 Tax=Maylandia zebra TaxID=106582 RepID=A0A3P9C5S0_9CICH
MKPLSCSTKRSLAFNSILSFHAFPTHSDLRRQWLVNIRRDHFTITSHTRVCCRHFASDQLIEPTTLDGRRRLIKGAVPTLFEWNGYKVEPPRRSVWERTERRPEGVPPDDQEEHSLTRDHDYCSVPEPSALDISASAAEDLSKDVETLKKEIQELCVQREFGLQRFSAYTREHPLQEECEEEQKGGDTPVMRQEALPCGRTLHYNSNCYIVPPGDKKAVLSRTQLKKHTPHLTVPYT